MPAPSRVRVLFGIRPHLKAAHALGQSLVLELFGGICIQQDLQQGEVGTPSEFRAPKCCAPNMWQMQIGFAKKRLNSQTCVPRNPPSLFSHDSESTSAASASGKLSRAGGKTAKTISTGQLHRHACSLTDSPREFGGSKVSSSSKEPPTTLQLP